MMTGLGGERAFDAEESRAAECERRRARAARWAGSGGREQDVATRPYIEDYHASHHDKSRMMQGGHGDLFGGDLDLFLFVLSKSIASLSSLGLFAVTFFGSCALTCSLLGPDTRSVLLQLRWEMPRTGDWRQPPGGHAARPFPRLALFCYQLPQLCCRLPWREQSQPCLDQSRPAQV